MKCFIVTGKDARQTEAAKYLEKLGYIVLQEEEAQLADYILLPTPLDIQNLGYTDILHKTKKGTVAFAGKICKQAYKTAEKAGVTLIDFLEREDLAMLNAIPTVEGTLEILIAERDKTLWSSDVVVTGYGRISKLLCHHLRALGTNVTVCARSAKDKAQAQAFGYKAVEITKLSKVVEKADIIINTVPALLIDEPILKTLKEDVFIVDLASRPGGVDFDMAEVLGINVNWALGLPAKTAPVTAGQFVVTSVLDIIKESEVC